MSKIEKELAEVIKCKHKDGESEQDYLARIVATGNSLFAKEEKEEKPEQSWGKLSTEAQNWFNAAVEAQEKGETIANFDGEIVEAAAEAPAEKAPKEKKSKKKAKPAEKEAAPVKEKAKEKEAAPAKAKAAAKKPAAKSAKEKSNGAKRPGRPSAFGMDQKITINAKENPHRPGTVLHQQFAKYKKGMTVKDALSAGVLLVNLHYLSGLGHIKIG